MKTRYHYPDSDDILSKTAPNKENLIQLLQIEF